MDKDILEKALDYLNKTQEFVLDQSPEVIIQIFNYEKTSTIFGIVFCAICIIFLISVATYSIFYPKLDKYDNREVFSQMLCFMPFLVCLPFGLTMVTLIDKLLKIYISPKYFLIDLLINKIK